MEATHSLDETLSSVAAALPQEFNFYHLGMVTLQPHFHSTEFNQGVAFDLYGDLRALVVILLSDGLDVSTYSELGNILVSKIANELFTLKKKEVMISPPQFLNSVQLEKLLKLFTPQIRKSYAHIYNNSIIPVETWILPAQSEVIGHA